MPTALAAVLAAVAMVLTGCRSDAPGTVAASEPPAAASATGTSAIPTTAIPTGAGPTGAGSTPASTPWQVGARPLPRRPDGFGQVQPTPGVLRDRRLPTMDRLPPPPGDAFAFTVQPVPADVLGRSSWQPACPVQPTELRYLTVAFWGFDGRHHTGELIVNAKVATDVVTVFRRLHAARFPFEEMRVVAAAELDAAPTGDGNNTTAFVCRPTRGQARWSAHAFGLAIDVNPFCNPYTRGDLVLPELASAYLDRSWARPGMVRAGDPAVRAFAAVGWPWGGTWSSPRDLMHFTATGG